MSNIRITELDFDQIKSNLKTYLQSQTEFTDYDFEGSGLSILLDVMAYNTHYNAYLANMLANEMFLDSAVKRASVVSIAKHLGYTPKSVTGSEAILDITVNNPSESPTHLTLERYTTFTSQINGTGYTFLNTEPVTITPTNGIYTFNDVKVKQGTLLSYYHTVVSPGPEEKYEIPNLDVDTSTLYVTVQTSSSDATLESFVLSDGIVDVKSDSKVYFLEESPVGKYQIYFGDGIIGKKLSAGNLVRIQYLVSAGSATNVSSQVAQSFTVSSIGGSANVSISVASNSTGGADKESISSIKFNAPRTNITKNRVVTKSDYISLIKSLYSTVESVSVWGGEENTPPVYGKVFISLKPYSGNIIDTITREAIIDTLRTRSVLTTVPEFVEPDYIYVKLDVGVTYNSTLSTKTSSLINTQSETAIRNYFSSNLQQFSKPFYYSQLIDEITAIDPSITGVVVELSVQKRLLPVLGVSNGYIDADALRFNNRLHPYEIESTIFYVVKNGIQIPVKIKDTPNLSGSDSYNGTGILKLYNSDTGIEVENIGTVDYPTGVITISSITPVGFAPGAFDIRITSGVQGQSYNITTTRNQIIELDDSTVNITAGRTAGLTINVTAE